MINTTSIVGRGYLANYRVAATLRSLLLLPGLVVVSGCSWSVDQNKGLINWQSSNTEINYRNPPKARNYLQPQSGMVICKDPQSAIAMALTGFFLDSCTRLEQANVWRVKSVSHRDMSNGQTLWLAEVVSTMDSDAETVTMWAPIPWHDWA